MRNSFGYWLKVFAMFFNTYISCTDEKMFRQIWMFEWERWKGCQIINALKVFWEQIDMSDIPFWSNILSLFEYWSSREIINNLGYKVRKSSVYILCTNFSKVQIFVCKREFWKVELMQNCIFSPDNLTSFSLRCLKCEIHSVIG